MQELYYTRALHCRRKFFVLTWQSRRNTDIFPIQPGEISCMPHHNPILQQMPHDLFVVADPHEKEVYVAVHQLTASFTQKVHEQCGLPSVEISGLCKDGKGVIFQEEECQFLSEGIDAP